MGNDKALRAPGVHTSAVSISAPGCHDRAVLLYEYVGKRIVDLQHTEVPDAYRGRGIAKHLAKVGWAADQNEAISLPLREDRLVVNSFPSRPQHSFPDPSGQEFAGGRGRAQILLMKLLGPLWQVATILSIGAPQPDSVGTRTWHVVLA